MGTLNMPRLAPWIVEVINCNRELTMVVPSFGDGVTLVNEGLIFLPQSNGQDQVSLILKVGYLSKAHAK